MPEAATGTPPLSGTLGEWPLPVILADLFDQHATGSLAVRPAIGSHVLYVKDGELKKAWATERDGREDRASDAGARAERLASIVTLPPETTYEFHAGVDLLGEQKIEGAELPIDPLASILVAARAWRDEARIEREIARLLGDRTLEVHRRATLARFALEDAEQKLVETFSDAPIFSYDALQGADVAPRAVIRSLVWALAATNHLTRGEEDHPFGVEIPDDAPQSRREPMPRSSLPPESTGEVRRVLAASEDLRRAEKFLEVGDVHNAEEAAASAVENDSTQPEYRALLAYLRGLQADPKRLGPHIAMLNKAITEDARSDRAFVYRAQLHELDGKPQLAAADYAKALAINPHNIDAKRGAAGRGDSTTRIRRSAGGGAAVSAKPPPKAETSKVFVLVGLLALAAILAAGWFFLLPHPR